MAKHRVTVRGADVELRGVVDMSADALGKFSEDMKPYGLVIASPIPEAPDLSVEPEWGFLMGEANG